MAALLPETALAQPNLQAVSIAASGEAVAGGTLTIDASIQGEGLTAPVSISWTAYLTVGGVLSGARELGPFGPVTVGLGRNAFEQTVTLPSNVTGLYQLALRVDSTSAISERNELDNTFVSPTLTRIRERAPELRVRAGFAQETERNPSDPIALDYTVQNAGELPATFQLAAHIGPTAVPGTSMPQLGETTITLAAGASTTGVISGLIPADLSAGDYYISLVVDPDGLVAEANEANNVFVFARTLNVFWSTLSLDTESLQDGALGLAYHGRLASSGGNGHYVYALASGDLPTGLALNPATGAITGVPTRSGTFMPALRVTSRGLSSTRTLPIVVSRNPVPLTILTRDVSPGFTGMPYEQVLIAGGGEPPYAWRITEGIVPPGLDVTPTGLISGIPQQLGRFSFTLEVRDRIGATMVGDYALDVSAVANVTVLLTDPPEATVGLPFDFQLLATGGVPPYRWTALSVPPDGLTVTENGRLTGTPSRVGHFAVRVRATDASNHGAKDDALVELMVLDDGSLNVSFEKLPPALVRSRFEQILEATGGTPPYDWALVPGTTLPEGFYLVKGDGEAAPVGAARLYGVGFRPIDHAFSVRVEDAAGRRREVPLAITVLRPDSDATSGCRCVAERSSPPLVWAGIGLGLLALLRRRQ